MADEMDYVMQHPEDNSIPSQQQQQQQQQQQHPQQQHQQPQLRQCPYWSEQPLSAFPSHYGSGLSLHPRSPSRNHPANPHHHQHHHHSPQASSSHSQHTALSPSSSRNQAAHPYDPVHSSIPALNNSWYPGSPSYHWSPVTLPHPRPTFDAFWQHPNGGQTNTGGASSTSSGAGVGAGATDNTNNSSSSHGRGAAGGLDHTSSSNPVQPPVAPNQQTPHHESFTPFPLAFHHQAAGVHRFPALAPTMSSPGQDRHGAQQPGQQQPPPPAGPAGFDFSRVRLPTISPYDHPPPNQMSQQQQHVSSTVDMPNAGSENVPAGNVVGSTATSGSMRPVTESTAQSRAPLPATSQTTTTPPRALVNAPVRDGPSLFGLPDNTRSAPTRRLLSNMRPRSGATRHGDSSDYDSDEDGDDHERTMELYTEMSGDQNFPLRGEALNEIRIRTQQLLRGQLSTKRVASKTALAALRSVDVDSLPEKDRTCIICYNDFGKQSPEGINEAPLRLPKCQHVFGDHCIKKWFEESDSCPYCRDKVPSEPQYRAESRAVREQILRLHNAYRPWTSDSQGGAAWGPERRASTAENGNDSLSTARSHFRELSRAGTGGSPTRSWQTGERRSPPSLDTLDNRRRTRPRHESFRASTAAGISGGPFPGQGAYYNPGNSSAPQYPQSPSRDRFPVGSYRPLPPYGTPEWNAERGRALLLGQPLGLNPPSVQNQGMYLGSYGYMPPPLSTLQPQAPAFQGQGQSGNTGLAMQPPGESSQAFLPRATPGTADYYGNGPSDLGFNPSGGNQGTSGTQGTQANSQANSSRQGFSFAPPGHQGTAIPNMENSW